jgi:hypothetical protein
MNDTNYKSPLLALEEEWELLTPSEKALCITYRRLLIKGARVSDSLIIQLNLIHQKYPDFHMGCIPSEGELLKTLNEGNA